MPQTYSVSNLNELYDALATATGGETILLAAGNYGDMALTGRSGFDTAFARTVTIASADPGNPAVITGLDVRGAQNLAFDGITFDYTFAPGDEIYYRPFSVSGSQNIAIRNSIFDGDVATGVSAVSDGYGYAVGLSFRDTAGVTIENNEFFDFNRGLGVSQSSDVVVRGNDIHDIRMDGMNFAEIAGALIENNYIHDFRGSANSLDHCDMIQFWTNRTDSPSTDITIRNNHLDIGNGTPTQSIFMRNEEVDSGRAGSEMLYQNILIEDNVIINGHLHGITVGETAGLTIRSNTVLHADGGSVDGVDSSVEIPQINVSAASKNVVIGNNAVADIKGFSGQPDWTVAKNAFVQDQDPQGFGFYGDVFLASSMNATDGVHAFSALQGGMLDRLDAGAVTTLQQPAAGLITAFHVERIEGNQPMLRFDASHSRVDAVDLPAETRFLWTFGDGTRAEGRTVTHAYANGGQYDVKLQILLPDGRRDTTDLTVAMQSPDVVSFVRGQGLVVNDYGTRILTDQGAAVTSEGLVLGRSGIAAQIDSTHVSRMLGQDDVHLSLTLAAATTSSKGEILRLHGSFIASVTDRGELSLNINTTEGKRIVLTTDGAQLSDRATHNVDITLANGRLSISVDDRMLAQTEMSGGLARLGDRDLTFGNPWGEQNFAGLISDFDLSVNAGDFATVRAARLLEAVPADDDDPFAVVLPVLADAKVETIEEPAAKSYVVPDPFTVDILAYVAGAGVFSGSGGAADSVVDFPDSDGIDVGKKGIAASIDRAYADDILGTDNFQIALSLKADKVGSAGEVVRLHSSFSAGIDADGEFFAQVFSTEEGRIRLKTEGANLNDTKVHDVDLTLNDGILSISVGGKIMASTAMTGHLVSAGRHDLVFGNPWGRANFDGHVSGFTIAMKDDAAAPEPAMARFAPIHDDIDTLFKMDMTYNAVSDTFSAFL